MEYSFSLWGEESSEINLVKKAVRGNTQAFAALMKDYKGYFYRIAYSYVKDEQKALDILHECTYKGLTQIHTLRNPQYFKTWMTRIVMNESLAVCQKESKIIYGEFEMAETKATISVEEKLDLYDAIDHLRAEFKTVIILMYFNDLSLEEISRTMDIPVNTVKSHLKRAKEQLKKVLKEEL